MSKLTVIVAIILVLAGCSKKSKPTALLVVQIHPERANRCSDDDWKTSWPARTEDEGGVSCWLADKFSPEPICWADKLPIIPASKGYDLLVKCSDGTRFRLNNFHDGKLHVEGKFAEAPTPADQPNGLDSKR